ncbi:MAG: hypothetical protein EOP05_02970 [Proteobacteria bacterium]|nr:MAG: hypothetical protein EOP05_02970 [Pseudomonadota bacterium]
MATFNLKTVAALLFLILSGCATYQTKVNDARNAIASENPEQAVALLKPLAEEESRDQLVYLLDYATALQQARKFKESAQAYQKAAQIAEVQDYYSVSKITASLVLTEEMAQYKGDDYEKVLINAMNAVNYLEMGNLDEALVEVKQLNLKLYKYRTEAKKNYEQNPYAYYLGAMIWEAQRSFDDAYIAYKNVYDIDPNYGPIKADLLRSARLAQRPDELSKWQKQFGESAPSVDLKNSGEVVLIFEQGWGPRKESRPENRRFPQLKPVYARTQRAKLEVANQSATTNEIFSVERVAIKTLNDDYARLVGSRVAGIGAKAVLADQVRQKNELLGAVAWIALNATDRADVRQWSTLPESFQIARMTLKPGKYKVKAIGLDAYGSESGEQMPEREIEVRAGKKVFVSWRSVR